MKAYNSVSDSDGDLDSANTYRFCQLLRAYAQFTLPKLQDKSISKKLNEDRSNAEEDLFSYGEEENADLSQYLGWAKQ